MILKDLKNYEYQELDLRTNVCYLLHGIRYGKMSTSVAAVMAHTDIYEKDFNAVVAYLSLYVEKQRENQSGS